MIKPLSSEEARALVREGRMGRLGCISEGEPYVVPVSYIFEGESIYVHSLTGRKIRAMRRDPRVCLQVDDIEDEYHWRSAIAFGEYEEITDSDERARVLDHLLGRFPHLTPIESVPVHDGQSSVVVFRIRVREVTGAGES
ncbi:MAG: pyridoxamine 5'-phosphate oxidase family protein [Blastocatellia bacterium]|nr:pyridoxamine 5'-phosphate oxidase family protein [Blastocatellia bacterium]